MDWFDVETLHNYESCVTAYKILGYQRAVEFLERNGYTSQEAILIISSIQQKLKTGKHPQNKTET